METIATFYARREAILARGTAEDQAALLGIERLLEVNPAFLAEFGDIPLVSTPLITVEDAEEEVQDDFEQLMHAWEEGTHLRRVALEALSHGAEAPDQEARAVLLLALALRIIRLVQAGVAAWEPA